MLEQPLALSSPPKRVGKKYLKSPDFVFFKDFVSLRKTISYMVKIHFEDYNCNQVVFNSIEDAHFRSCVTRIAGGCF